MACLYSSILSFSLSLSDILSLSVDISICASSLRSSCSVLRMVPRPCEEAPTAPTLLPPSCPHAPDVLFMSLQKSSRSARLLCTCDRSIAVRPRVARPQPVFSIIWNDGTYYLYFCVKRYLLSSRRMVRVVFSVAIDQEGFRVLEVFRVFSRFFSCVSKHAVDVIAYVSPTAAQDEV